MTGSDEERVARGDGRLPGESDRDATGSTGRRLLWFGLLWLGGVASVSVVAWAIRSMIMP